MLKDRFANYQPGRSIDERLAMAARIKGCSGVEIIYPQDFDIPEKVPELLKKHGLQVSAINLNVKAEEIWRFGSFTHSQASVRRTAVDYMRRAMDYAAQLGCNLVTSAFLNDGADYPFESDYIASFNRALDSVREAASHRSDVRVALEYKASEPRAHCFLGNAGKAAYFASLTGMQNVGVNVDIGHALQAGEIPGDSIAFLGATGKLFYVHINDNYRNWDWDLVPGTVNLWDYIEAMLYLRRVKYDGWIAADVFPGKHDPVRIMEKTIEWITLIERAAESIDEKELVRIMESKDAFDTLDYVRGLLKDAL